jgi:hypothetical protein
VVFTHLTFAKEGAGMSRWLRAALFLIVLVTVVSGCGLLPTDRPPSDHYGASYFPDDSQPRYERLLFGTRWIPEGPPLPLAP